MLTLAPPKQGGREREAIGPETKERYTKEATEKRS
jgi:hypothetical protein